MLRLRKLRQLGTYDVETDNAATQNTRNLKTRFSGCCLDADLYFRQENPMKEFREIFFFGNCGCTGPEASSNFFFLAKGRTSYCGLVSEQEV